MSDEIENNDSTNVETDHTEVVETVPEEVLPEVVVETLEDAELLKDKNRQLFARAKKAEAENKELKKPKPVSIPAKEDDINKIIDQKLEERELNSLEVSDELKKELKTYAQAGGLTLKQAMTSNYFKFLKKEETSKAKAEDASIGGKRRATTNFSETKLADIDISTEEGRKEYEDFKKHRGRI